MNEDDLIDAFNEIEEAEPYEGPDDEAEIELTDEDVIPYMSPENVAELIADHLDGTYDEGYDVSVDAGNDRHIVNIYVENLDQGFRKKFFAVVRVDNS